jgi:peptidyl-prolyl cis-trans isomerase SurA
VQAMTETGITEPITVDNGVYIVAVRGKRDPADTETRVDLVRLSVNDGSEAALQAAVEEANGCAGARTLANNDSNLQAVDLDDVRLKDLGAESQQMLSSVAEGDATSIFTTSGTVAVLYVCKREESGANMPTRDQIQDSLFGRQLSMIAERSLRNLRRDATIIQRGS